MAEPLPDPFVPAEVDLRDYPYTPLFRARLFGSSFHARSTDAEWRAGVTLWLKSWDQVPAGTLPDDEIDLCRLAELGRDLKAWRKVMAGALRGWVKCNDGRLHHAVVAEGVMDAWERRKKQRDRGARGGQAKWRKHRSALAQAGDGDSASMANAIAQSSDDDGTSSTAPIAQAERKHDPSNASAMLSDSKGREEKGREEEDSPQSPPGGLSSVARDFSAWWERYPEKVGKGAAAKAYAKARRKADAETLLAGIARYIQTKPADRNWCHPATWLNQERWLDQPAAMNGSAHAELDELGLPKTPISELGKATDELYRRMGVRY